MKKTSLDALWYILDSQLSYTQVILFPLLSFVLISLATFILQLNCHEKNKTKSLYLKECFSYRSSSGTYTPPTRIVWTYVHLVHIDGGQNGQSSNHFSMKEKCSFFLQLAAPREYMEYACARNEVTQPSRSSVLIFT